MAGISFSFRFIIFVNLWPISTLCVADMVHAVANMVCGRCRRFPVEARRKINVELLGE